MTSLTQAITEALFHSLWQGVLVAALLWLMLFLLRTRSANARYLASCGALFGLFALSLITVLVVYEQPGPPGLQSQAVRWTPSGSAAGWAVVAQQWAFPVWTLGVALFSLRLIWGYVEVSSWRSKGTPGDEPLGGIVAGLAERMGIRQHVDVLISSLADAPGMIGWIRPILLVPAATVAGLTPQQLESILAHELAHIRRHDYLVNIGQMVVETLLFYHPAIWWASRQIRRERELACDDLAVKSVGDALSYARALAALEKTRVLAPNLAMGSTKRPLMYRVQRLLSPQGHEHGPSKLAGVTVLFLLIAASLFLSLNWATAQTAKTGTTPAATARPPAPRATPEPHFAQEEARAFLNTQLLKFKANLEEAEDRLQAYSQANGMLHFGNNLEESLGIEVARLTTLQDALTAAQIERFHKDAVVQVTEGEIGNIPTFNATLLELRRQDASLAASGQAPQTLSRRQIQAQIEVVENGLISEALAALQRAQAERRIVDVKEGMLKREAAEQRLKLNELSQKHIQYEILKREAESNRQGYEDLLRRIREAEQSKSLARRGTP